MDLHKKLTEINDLIQVADDKLEFLKKSIKDLGKKKKKLESLIEQAKELDGALDYFTTEPSLTKDLV